jgi:hypothetical protein
MLWIVFIESTTSLEVGAVTLGTLKETALPLPLPSAVGVDEEVDAVASVLGLASFEADAEVRAASVFSVIREARMAWIVS